MPVGLRGRPNSGTHMGLMWKRPSSEFEGREERMKSILVAVAAAAALAFWSNHARSDVSPPGSFTAPAGVSVPADR